MCVCVLFGGGGSGVVGCCEGGGDNIKWVRGFPISVEFGHGID